MLLCEVSLGKEKVYGEKTNEEEEEYDSMKGPGQNIPDPENAVYDESGVSTNCQEIVSSNNHV